MSRWRKDKKARKEKNGWRREEQEWEGVLICDDSLEAQRGGGVCFWLFLLLFCPATLLPFQWFVPSFPLQFSGLLLSFCIFIHSFLPRSVHAFSSCMFSCLGFCAFSCLSLHFQYFLCMCVFSTGESSMRDNWISAPYIHTLSASRSLSSLHKMGHISWTHA